MGTLLLIRHGQASFLADHYDVLSDLGAAQSRALGTYLTADLHQVDAVYVGPRDRHRDTAANMRAGARDSGGDLPEPILSPALDEFPFEDMVQNHLSTILERHPDLAAMLPGNANGSERESKMGQLLGAISGRWAHGSLDIDDLVESYDQFCERVVRGVERIVEDQGRGKTVALVTSGGPVTVYMREVLGVGHADRSWKQAWVVRNTSISEYKYRDDDVTMVSWNSIPHLRESSMVTYR